MLKSDQLQTGDVILFYLGFSLFKPMSWLTYLIRKFAKSKYNHAGIIVSNWGKLFLNEAIGKGVISRPIENQFKGYGIKVIRKKDINILYEKELATRINSRLGIKYDYASLIYQAIYQLTGKWFGKIGKDSEGRNYCYEYVAWCLGYEEYWKSEPKQFENTDEYNVIFEEYIDYEIK